MKKHESPLQAQPRNPAAKPIESGSGLPSDDVQSGLQQISNSSNVLHKIAEGMSPTGRQAVADVEKLAADTAAMIKGKEVPELLRDIAHEADLAAMTDRGKWHLHTSLITSTLNEASTSAKSTKELAAESYEVSQETAGIINDLSKTARLMVISPEFRGLVAEFLDIATELVTGALPEGKAKAGTEKAGHALHKDKTSSLDKAIKNVEKSVTDKGDMLKEVQKETHSVIDKYIFPAAAKVTRGDASVIDVAHDAANATAERLRTAADHMALTQEQKDRVWARMANLAEALNSSAEYQHCLNLVQGIVEHLACFANEASEITATLTSEQHLHRAIVRMQCLLQNLAGGHSLQPVVSAAKSLIAGIRQDNETSELVSQTAKSLGRLFREPKSFADMSSRRSLESNMDSVSRVLASKYSAPVESLHKSMGDFINAMLADTMNRQVYKDVQRVVGDFFLDAAGKPTIKTELIADFAQAMAKFVTSIKFIPLPRITHEDETLRFVLDDIAFYCCTILPEQFVINTVTQIALTEQGVPSSTRAHVSMSRVYGEASDVVFYYHRKATPCLSDTGLLDVDMTHGKGLSIDFDLVVAATPDPVLLAGRNRATLAIANVSVDVDDLRLIFHDTAHHDMLYSIFSPIINARAKAALEADLETCVKDMMLKATQTATDAAAKTREMAGWMNPTH